MPRIQDETQVISLVQQMCLSTEPSSLALQFIVLNQGRPHQARGGGLIESGNKDFPTEDLQVAAQGRGSSGAVAGRTDLQEKRQGNDVQEVTCSGLGGWGC